MEGSKEKINPGETCPFCGTVTNPGSIVCHGCGAERELRSTVSTAKVCLWLVGGLAVLLASAQVAYIARQILLIIPLPAAYIVFTVPRLRSQRAYFWIRRSIR